MSEIVSLGQTRVQSVSLIPSTRRRCNGQCKSCIARMTPGAMEDKPNYVPMHRVKDILDYGKQAGAMTAIITSKSEPTLDHEQNAGHFMELLQTCRERLPQVDLQTNAFLLERKKDRLEWLVDNGLNMLTISLASFIPEINRAFMGIKYNPEKVIAKANKLGIIVRCSLLLTKETVDTVEKIVDYIKSARDAGVDMVVVRELWQPDDPEDSNDSVVAQWVRTNAVPMQTVETNFDSMAKANGKIDGLPIRLVRLLPWGAQVYDVGGVNTTFARCDEKYQNGTYKSIQLVPRTYPNGSIGWRIQGSWGSAGDVLG